jgi:hypothetical protein
MSKRDLSKLCVNGLAGYDTESGLIRAVKHPCENQRVPGHTLCDRCREDAGGMPKSKLNSPRSI